MDMKRTAGQKWEINIQDVITNCTVPKCDAYREYAYFHMLLSILWLEKISRKWLQQSLHGVCLNWKKKEEEGIKFYFFIAEPMWYIAKIHWYPFPFYVQTNRRIDPSHIWSKARIYDLLWALKYEQNWCLAFLCGVI